MSDKLTREQIEETRKMVHEWVEAGLWDASRLLEFDPIFDAALAHLEAHRAEASKDGEGERVGYAEALDMAYIECFACSCDRCPLTHPCQDLNRWMPADAAAHPAPSPDGFRQCAEHGPWHVEDGICHGCAHPIPDAERREKHWREAAVAAIWRFNQERAEDDGWVQTQADQVVNGLRAHLASKPAPEAGECLECGQKPGTWEGCGTCDTGRGLEAHDLHTCTPAPPAVCEHGCSHGTLFKPIDQGPGKDPYLCPLHGQS